MFNVASILHKQQMERLKTEDFNHNVKDLIEGSISNAVRIAKGTGILIKDYSVIQRFIIDSVTIPINLVLIKEANQFQINNAKIDMGVWLSQYLVKQDSDPVLSMHSNFLNANSMPINAILDENCKAATPALTI